MLMLKKTRRWRPHWLLLATCFCSTNACLGTPTPEPPDNLPRPDGDHIFGSAGIAVTVDFPSSPVCLVTGDAASVGPNSKLWVVDLDDPNGPALDVQADATGAFAGKLAAKPGDRVRLVTRTARQHSLPLDAQCVLDRVQPSTLSALPSTGLPCVELTPSELSRTVGATDGGTDSFQLTNHCTSPLSVTQARLRFGDQGFALGAQPETIPAGGSGALTVRFAGRSEPGEHGDILLLELQSGELRGRYALGVWSQPRSVGND